MKRQKFRNAKTALGKPDPSFDGGPLPNGQPPEVSVPVVFGGADETDALTDARITALTLGRFRNFTALPPSNFAFTSGEE